MATKTLKWLNEQLIEKVFKKSENDHSIKILNINVNSATNAGDNYTSEIYRVRVHYTQMHNDKKHVKTTSVIIKVSPTHLDSRNNVIGERMFGTEISMMLETLKEMNNLLGNQNLLSGRGLFGQKEEPIFLVMEDLANFGFRMADRNNGLDLRHCILAIQGLARFHASSVKLCEQNPGIKSKYNKGLFSPENLNDFPEMIHFFNDGTKNVSKVVSTWPNNGQKYAKKILNISNRIYQLAMKASELRSNDFNVINHGDYWVNNMLFQYNNAGEAVRHIMVDFQLCKYTSHAIDLLHFLNTSLSDEVFGNKTDIILKEYHQTLCATMKRLECETQPPNLTQLNRCLEDRAIYGMVISFTILPLILVDKDKAQTAEEMDPNGIHPGVYSSRYREVMMKRLPIYDKMGLFDL